LNENELARAIAHESAHIRNHDNIKKLALRVCHYPPSLSLEHSWLEALEIAADQSAVNSKREALDLASALVKSSRLSCPSPELVTNLASPAGTLLHNRVERLLAWEQTEVTGHCRRLFFPATLLMLATLLVTRYDLWLSLVHELAEVLMK
jgi:beta-lactamase regulating signal transducer with metallopeptidase domain